MELGNCPKCGKPLVNVCPECGEPVDVYSRIVGYLRPIKTWNDGKQQEFVDRKTFLLKEGDHVGEGLHFFADD